MSLKFSRNTEKRLRELAIRKNIDFDDLVVDIVEKKIQDYDIEIQSSQYSYFKNLDLLGCFEGPEDLSENFERHFENISDEK